MDRGFIYSYGFTYTSGSPKSDSPDASNQLPVRQVHLGNPKGLLNQHVQNSLCHSLLPNNRFCFYILYPD